MLHWFHSVGDISPKLTTGYQIELYLHAFCYFPFKLFKLQKHSKSGSKLVGQTIKIKGGEKC